MIPALGAPLSLKARLSAFYGGYFLVAGVLAPFWPLFLSAKGMNASQIGILLTLTVWVRVVASPAISRVAERTGECRRPMIAAGAAALFFSAFFFLAEGFWPLLAVSFAAYFAYSCLLPLGETLTLRRVSVEGGYGRVRLWGSVSFILAAGVGGYLLDAVSLPSSDLILLFVLGSLAVALLGASALPDARLSPMPKTEAPLRRLIASRPFVFLIAATALIHAGHAVFYGFSTLHWAASGISKTVIGFLWGEAVLAEILLFAFGAGLVARLGVARLLLIAASAGLVRWTVTAISTEVWALALVQWLHAATFGAMHLAAMQFITRAVPGTHAVTAQSVYAGVSNGAAIGFGLLLAGWLFGAYAGAAFYLGVGFSLLALIAVALFAWSWNGKEIIESARE